MCFLFCFGIKSINMLSYSTLDATVCMMRHPLLVFFPKVLSNIVNPFDILK